MNKLFESLNKNHADLNIFYIKLHQFHWLVEGKGFFTLHSQFEKTYEEIHDLYDEIAERLVALEAVVATTTKEYLKLSTIKEIAFPKTDGVSLVEEVLKDLQYLNESLTETIKISDEMDDFVTSDMLTVAISEIQKSIWQYKAYLK